MLYEEKRQMIQTPHGRRETRDRRKHEIAGLIRSVLAGQFLSKRRRERRNGWDRRSRSSPAHQ